MDDIQEHNNDIITYRHYVRPDAKRRIVHAFTDKDEQTYEGTGDVCINEAGGPELELCGEIKPKLDDEYGVPRFALTTKGKVVLRSEADMLKDRPDPPVYTAPSVPITLDELLPLYAAVAEAYEANLATAAANEQMQTLQLATLSAVAELYEMMLGGGIIG